jgi:hypothetical protein
MAQVTIFKDAGITVEVIDGSPPIDQATEVAALTAQVASLAGERDALQVKLDTLNAAIDAAQGQ